MTTDYKKWDKFAADLSDSDAEEASKPSLLKKYVAPPANPSGGNRVEKEKKLKQDGGEAAMVAAKLQNGKKKYEKRKKVTFQGRTIYEWEQTLEEVDIYINPPPGVTSRQIVCNIKSDHLEVGIKGAPLYMDEKLGGLCVKSESYWMIEDGVLHINLQKQKCGDAWMGATQHKGHQLNSMEQQEIKQQVLLERFQREHPGFDFSGAKFNGVAPDARKFMGGINTGELNRNVAFN
ncbi:hypothetical protein AAMO2058_000740200 [Amorphochlora amoebiformis]